MIGTCRDAELVWDVRTAEPALFQALVTREPSLAELVTQWSAALPHLRTRLPVQHQQHVRLRGHGRSWYYGLEASGERTGTIALKGTEPLCDDFNDWLDEMAQSRYYVKVGFSAIGNAFPLLQAEVPMLHRWPVYERKVPGAVTLPEALSSARFAAELQQAHLGRYGELARVPAPILVFRLPRAVQAQVWAQLEARLPRVAREVVSDQLRDGIGAYLYYYPQLPVRLSHLDRFHGVPSVGSGVSYADRLQAMRKLGIEPRQTIGRWLDLFVRMWCLGYFAQDPLYLATADCLQAWNMVVDGGMVDIDSLARMADTHDEHSFGDMMRRGLRDIAIDVAFLLLGYPATNDALRDQFPEINYMVWREIADRLAAAAHAPGGLDSRLRRFFAPASAFDGLDQTFRLLSLELLRR